MPMKQIFNIDGIKCEVQNMDNIKGYVKNINLENGKVIYKIENYTKDDLTEEDINYIIEDSKYNIGKNNFIIKKNKFIKNAYAKIHNDKLNIMYNNALYEINTNEKERHNKIFECICGQKIRRIDKFKHKRNKEHIKFINNLTQ